MILLLLISALSLLTLVSVYLIWEYKAKTWLNSRKPNPHFAYYNDEHLFVGSAFLGEFWNNQSVNVVLPSINTVQQKSYQVPSQRLNNDPIQYEGAIMGLPP
jgi:hypothetical protein